MNPTATHIGLVGSFDLDNFGDLMFPIVFEHQLAEHLHLLHVSLYSARGGVFSFDSRAVHPAEQLLEDAAQLSAIVIGGGAIVRFDDGPYPPSARGVSGGMQFWFVPTLAAAAHNIPLLWNAPSVPYALSRAQVGVVQGAMDLARYLTVRDEPSVRRLPATTRPIAVVPDSVFSIAEVWPKTALVSPFAALQARRGIRAPYVVFHLSRTTAMFPDTVVIADALRAIAQRHRVQVVLLPIGPVHGEIDSLAQVRRHHPADMTLIGESLPLIERAALIAHSAAFLGSSLHGNITAFAYEVPRLVLNTAQVDKLSEFCSQTGSRQVTEWPGLADAFGTLPRVVGSDEAARRAAIAAGVHGHFHRMAEAITAPRPGPPASVALVQVVADLAAEAFRPEGTGAPLLRPQIRDPALREAQAEIALYATRATAAGDELTRWRQRRIISWVERFRPPRDRRPVLRGLLQSVLDDGLLFHRGLRGFRLRPSVNLQGLDFLPYPLELGVPDLCGVRLVPLVDFPCAQGVLGIEIVAPDNTIVVHQTLPLADVDETSPTSFEFSPLPGSDRGRFWLRVFVRDAPYPVRIYEWHRYRWRGFGRREAYACCAYTFETDKATGS